MTIKNILREGRRFLGIRLPVTVHLYDGEDTPQGWDGAHTLKRRKRHLIDLPRKPSRGCHSILAHELVHAYLEEVAPTVPIHGRLFQYYAQQFENHLQSLGYDVQDIYDKALDK